MADVSDFNAFYSNKENARPFECCNLIEISDENGKDIKTINSDLKIVHTFIKQTSIEHCILSEYRKTALIT